MCQVTILSALGILIRLMFTVTSGSIKKQRHSPGQMAQLLGASSHTPKGWGFDPWLGRLLEATDGCFSFTLTFLSLPTPLSQKSINISLVEDLKKKRNRGTKTLSDLAKITEKVSGRTGMSAPEVEPWSCILAHIQPNGIRVELPDHALRWEKLALRSPSLLPRNHPS